MCQCDELTVICRATGDCDQVQNGARRDLKLVVNKVSRKWSPTWNGNGSILVANATARLVFDD